MKKDIFLLFVTFICGVSCDFGVIYARQQGTEWNDHFCLNYNPQFSKLPESIDEAVAYPLSDLSHDFGCKNSSAYDDIGVKGTVVFVARGNCTFSEKALMAVSHGAVGVVIITSSLVLPAANQSSDFDIINITVASIEKDHYETILKEGKPIEVLLLAPDTRSTFDPCVVVIFALAMFCIIVGGYWSGVARHQQYEKKVKSKKTTKRVQAKEDKENDDDDDGPMDLTIPVIIVFFVLVCVFLVLLYFFYDYLVYVVIALFCLATTISLFYCVQPVWNYIPWNSRISVNKVPCCTGKVLLREVLLAMICIGISVFWGVQRHASYAWVIQDFLGVAFCVNMLKTIQMPNLKICIVLLVLLFLYDVFFVFITPLFTKTGESIMVKVATGGSSSTGEQLPMVFKVPKLGSSPITVCDLPYSLLGFGDIIVPGLLISYNHAFDMKVKSKRIYFIASTIAYAVGLLFTFIALYVMESGQPALLYLVPCTLITTFVIGCIRGEAKLLWGGFSQKQQSKKTDDTPPQQADKARPSTPEIISPENVSVSSLSSSEGENKTLLRK